MSQRKTDPRLRGDKALDWSDEEMARLAQVTAEDIDEAVALWKRSVPRAFAGLIDAPLKEPTVARR